MPADLCKNFRIILASKSPRRQLLLKELGIPFHTITRETDERFPSSLKGSAIVEFLSRKKVESFRDILEPNSIVITADTIVWINDHALNKPADEMEAFSMLKEMQGRMHEVFTGVTLFSQKNELTFCVRSVVEFIPLTDEQIRKYISTKKPFDKAGAYGAQECLAPGSDPTSEEEKEFLNSMGKTSLLQNCIPPANVPNEFAIVKKITGSYFNVMGLPIVEVAKELQRFGQSETGSKL